MPIQQRVCSYQTLQACTTELVAVAVAGQRQWHGSDSGSGSGSGSGNGSGRGSESDRSHHACRGINRYTCHTVVDNATYVNTGNATEDSWTITDT